MDSETEDYLHEAVQCLWKASIKVDDPDFEAFLSQMKDDLNDEWRKHA